MTGSSNTNVTRPPRTLVRSFCSTSPSHQSVGVCVVVSEGDQPRVFVLKIGVVRVQARLWI